AINDIGWHARVRGTNGTAQRGFRVTGGGGTAILCKSGYELYEFLPAGDILEVAEAIVRVFHRLGDYAHKQRNRMKFLIRDIGFEAWRGEFEKERVAGAAARSGAAEVRGPGIVPPAPRTLAVRSDEAARWLATNVRAQKQDGY